MPSLLEKLKRLTSPVPPGYNHPALTESFNKLAQSPFGRQAVAYCKRRDYEIIVTDQLPENTLGTCGYKEITLRPTASYTTMAHEMRHAFQQHSLRTREEGHFNPLFLHMELRMTEADAFTYTTLVQLSRWKELGYSRNDPFIKEDKNDTDRISINAWAAYTDTEFDPQSLLEILRQVFNYYYELIAFSSGNLSDTYEGRAMEEAGYAYQRLENALNPPRTMMQAIVNAFLAPDRKTDLQNKIAEYHNTATLIETLAEKLGHIPGLEGNYLTGTTGQKLSGRYYVGLAKPEVLKFHRDWHGKIQAKINGHKLLAPPPGRPPARP